MGIWPEKESLTVSPKLFPRTTDDWGVVLLTMAWGVGIPSGLQDRHDCQYIESCFEVSTDLHMSRAGEVSLGGVVEVSLKGKDSLGVRDGPGGRFGCGSGDSARQPNSKPKHQEKWEVFKSVQKRF